MVVLGTVQVAIQFEEIYHFLGCENVFRIFLLTHALHALQGRDEGQPHGSGCVLWVVQMFIVDNAIITTRSGSSFLQGRPQFHVSNRLQGVGALVAGILCEL